MHLGGAAPLAARARRPRGLRLRRPQRVLATKPTNRNIGTRGRAEAEAEAEAERSTHLALAADVGHALVTQEQIQLLRVHRRHQRLTDRSHTNYGETRSQPTQLGSRARKTRSREVVAALPPYGLRPCLPAVSMSSPATAPSLTFSLDFSPSGAPVSLSPSLGRSFVCFGFSPARESCSGAQRSAELVRGLCCLSVAAAPALLALPLPARSSSLLSPRPDGHRRVASGGPHLWPAPNGFARRCRCYMP